MKEIKWAAGSWVIGGHRDRFVDYHPSPDLQEKLKRLAQDGRIKGVEVICPYDNIDVAAIRPVLAELGLKVSAVLASGINDLRFQLGGLSAQVENMRTDALGELKKAAELAKALDSDLVNVWPGQDGFDYAFQLDYGTAWDQMLTSLKEAATSYPDIRFALEYKPYEPRASSLLPTMWSALVACQELDLPNVGITLDFGHAILAHENPAQAAALAARHGRLFNVHLNDTFGRFDDDFLPATKHIMETIEFLWQLKQLNYNGWVSLDMSPARQVPEEAVTYSLDILEMLWEKASSLDEAALDLKGSDVISTWRYLWQHLLG
ncbi:MAG: sugar phosphate isomerase/epimerase [Firmicutes bacterium]|nr:sugar phosphate isomerase/epimerase [Bacillota bacterium]